MSNLYKFKFHSEFFDLELESTDQSFIESKVMELIELSSKGYKSSPKLLNPAQTVDLLPVEDAEEVAAVPKRGKKSKKTKAGRPKSKAKSAAKRKPGRPAVKKSTRAAAPAKPATSAEAFDAGAVAERVRSDKHFDVFENKILGKANQLNRILLSFYYSDQVHGGKSLTTGDVESITKALGTEIKSTNISSQIKKHKDLFIIEGERKRGAVVHYKLNKKGLERFQDTVEKMTA